LLRVFPYALEEGNNGWLADVVLTSNDKERDEIIQIESVLHHIRSEPNVLAVSSRSYATGALKQKDRWVPAGGIMGLDVNEEKKVSKFQKGMIEGAFLKEDSASDEIVLGQDLADSLVGGDFDGVRAHAGESLLLRNDVGEIKKYRIIGVVNAKTFSPNSMAFLPKNEVENFLLATKNTEVVVHLFDDNKNNVLATQTSLQKFFPKLLVQTSEQRAGFVQDILSAVSYIVAIINTLLIFVVFFIVNIVMYISVTQEKRQIGILKSIGCTNRFIVSVNILKALFYGLIAYSLGLFIYIILYGFSVQNPYPLLIGDFKMGINSSQMIFSLFLILFGVVFGSLIPSLIAAKTSIIDVLRDSE
jgi:ABC-type lipoprotein release transport system permease subunit